MTDDSKIKSARSWVAKDESGNDISDRFDEIHRQQNQTKADKVAAAVKPAREFTPAMKEALFDDLDKACVAAKELLGPAAYVSLNFTSHAGQIEVVWEVGVQKIETSKGERGQAVNWTSRDLWGRAGSLQEALRDADVAKNSRASTRRGNRP